MFVFFGLFCDYFVIFVNNFFINVNKNVFYLIGNYIECCLKINCNNFCWCVYFCSVLFWGYIVRLKCIMKFCFDELKFGKFIIFCSVFVVSFVFVDGMLFVVFVSIEGYFVLIEI